MGYKDKKSSGSAPSSGRGFREYKGVTTEESVNKFPHTGVPGDESEKGSWIDAEGPNSPQTGGKPRSHGSQSSLPRKTTR